MGTTAANMSENTEGAEHGVGTRSNNTFGSITHRRRVINNMKKFWKSPIDQEQHQSSDSSDPQTPVAAFSKKLSLSLTPNPATKHSAMKSPSYSPCFTGKSSRRSSFTSSCNASPGNKSKNASSEFTDAEESEAEDTSSNIMCLQLLPTESKRNLLTNWECIPPPTKSPSSSTKDSKTNKDKKIAKKRRPPTRSVAGSTKREEKRVPTKVSTTKTATSLPPPKSPLRVTIRRKCNKRPKDLKKSKKAAAMKSHNSNNSCTTSPMKPTSSIIINDSKSKNKKTSESKSPKTKPNKNSSKSN